MRAACDVKIVAENRHLWASCSAAVVAEAAPTAVVVEFSGVFLAPGNGGKLRFCPHELLFSAALAVCQVVRNVCKSVNNLRDENSILDGGRQIGVT